MLKLAWQIYGLVYNRIARRGDNMADKEIEIVTSKQIMAIAEIPNGSEKQAQINKIIYCICR